MSLRSARRWLRALTPARRGTRAAKIGSSAGTPIANTTKAVQTSAALPGNIHPASSAAILAGADNVRRRLSNIFHRAISGNLRRPRVAPAASPLPKIHGSSCQSPRAQRCWRAAATSYLAGNSSTTSISETRPARAKTPSKRS